MRGDALEYFLTLLEHKDIVTNNKDLFYCIIVALIIFYYKMKHTTCDHHDDVCEKIVDIEDNYLFVEECLKYLTRHMYLMCAELELKPDKEPTHHINRREQ